MDYGIGSGKSLSLGMPKAPNVKFKDNCGTPAQINRNAPYSSPEIEEKSLEYGAA